MYYVAPQQRNSSYRPFNLICLATLLVNLHSTLKHEKLTLLSDIGLFIHVLLRYLFDYLQHFPANGIKVPKATHKQIT